MRVVKPIWIKHDESNKDTGKTLSIFSIDIHPDGNRVATGGQGNDCGRVAIWNMAPIRNTDAEQNKVVPKLLCTIDSHLQCVNAVRWSSSGFYLASAGDDQLIMIWTLSGRHSGPGPTETYRLVSTLRSHSGDILDLSWSHGDQWLASCSVDNMIVVWNAQRWPEIVTTLRGHSGLVKGVSFDPIGKYLASQSDDKSLRVWRVSDWTEEVVISEPFEQCGGTTHVLRLSWSPDGQFLVSAQAMNNCGSVAKIIDRQDWRADKDFVGHRKAIPVVRFNSNIFKFQSGTKTGKGKANNKDNKENQKEVKLKRQSVLAVGSRDRSISIWATARGSRPLMVCKDLFENSILDFSWSRKGYELMACSSDGTVAFIEFTEKELGPKVSEDEKCQYLQQLYGKNLGNSKSALMNNLIEDLDIMKLQKRQQKEEEELDSSIALNSDNNNGNSATANHRVKTPTTTNGAVSAAAVVEDLISTTNRPVLEKPSNPVEMLSNHSNSSKGGIGSGLRLAKGPLDKQIEIRSADGRRRIIPLFIPPLSDAIGDEHLNPTAAGGSVSAAAGSLNSMSFSSSSEAKSKIVIETRDESNPPLEYMTYVSSDQVMPNGLTKRTTTTTSAASAGEGTSERSESTQKAPSMNGSCVTGKQTNNVSYSNNNTNDSSDYRPKSPVPSTSSTAPITNGTMVNGTNKPTQVRPESSNDSSSSDIIIRRPKKRKTSIDNSQPPPQQQNQQPNEQMQQMQQQQTPTIPVKRKPGRPPGSGANQQASKQQQQQQISNVVEAGSLNRLNEATALQNGPKSILSHEADIKRTAVTVAGPSSTSKTTSSSTENNRVTSNHSTSSSSSSYSRRHNFFPALKLSFQQSPKISTKLFVCSETGKMYTAEVERPLVSSSVCKLTLVVDNDEPQWSVLLSATICALTANQQLVVVACDDGSLNAFNTATGSRTLVPLIVESPVARMVIANRFHLLLITCNAKLWLWDLQTPPKVLLKGESLLPLLIHRKTGEQLAIQSASVAATGRPVVAVANGRTYMYESDLSSWVLIADVSNPLNACTDLKPSSLTGVRGATAVAKMPSRSLQNFFSSNAPIAQHGLISFIEQQLETAKLMANGKDYRYWLGTLVQNLVSLHSSGFNTENIEQRLRELCNFLIGGQFPQSAAAAGLSTTVSCSSSTPLPAIASRSRTNISLMGGGANGGSLNSNNKVLGMSKHELLREVLAILASNLALQRLYLEYKDQLDSFSSSLSMSTTAASASTSMFNSTIYHHHQPPSTPKTSNATGDTAAA